MYLSLVDNGSKLDWQHVTIALGTSTVSDVHMCSRPLQLPILARDVHMCCQLPILVHGPGAQYILVGMRLG